MLSPHESLNLNPKRGLLAAVIGNPSTYPGLVSIYDVSKDCRHPVLQSTSAVARLGHESGFSPDGKTFYATGTARESITAVDVTNPKEPHAVWQGNVVSHGMTLSDDGNRAYIADVGGNMLILDVSQIQARKPNPQAREVSRLTWHAASIPQNAIPFTDHGHPYVLEFDEYTQGTTGARRREHGRRGPHHRHRGRARAARRRQPAAAGQPAGGPQGGERRPRRRQPGAGLRGALLQPLEPGRPDGRGVLVHRLRAARVRHQRPPAPEGDRATTWRRPSRGRRTSSWPATSRCPSR